MPRIKLRKRNGSWQWTCDSTGIDLWIPLPGKTLPEAYEEGWRHLAMCHDVPYPSTWPKPF
jgi:hypothetical protein